MIFNFCLNLDSKSNIQFSEALFMKAKRIATAIISIAFVIFLLLCSYSGPVRDGHVYAPVNGPLKITFSGGSFPADSESLSFPIQASEFELLDYFTALKSADFSGSTCYDEIKAWSEAHPEVEVNYTLHFPVGEDIGINAEAIDLTGLDSSMVEETAKLLGHTRNLKSIDLGQAVPGSSLSGEEISAIHAAAPKAKISYTIELFGETLSIDTESLSYPSLKRTDVDTVCAALSCMTNLKNLDLGSEDTNDLTYDDISRIEDACPGANVSYVFTLCGQSVNANAENLNFSHVKMDDQGAAVRSAMPIMRNCKVLDMDFCGVSNENMARIREENPNTKVIWRIWFGDNYSVRTDVERILASKPSKGGVIDNDEVGVIKYCTDLKYLDLGHNNSIYDLSFLYGTPNIEVLVLAMNPLTDITPLASCPKLEYLELNSTQVADLSPLAGLKELRHLNIGNCQNVTDISPIYNLTELERFWIGSIDPVPPEQVAKMQECAPDCVIDTVTVDPTSGTWRLLGYTELSLKLYAETGWLQEVLHPRYKLLKEQFGYTDADYAFYWNDPLY